MAIADWYTGVAQKYLKKVGTREELTNGYGVSARELRRWINAFNEGGIPGLLSTSTSQSIGVAGTESSG